MKLFRTLFFISLFINSAQAQFVTNNKRVADIYFQNREYYAAAEYYKKALQISPDSTGFVVPYGFDKTIKKESPKKEDYEYTVHQLATSLRLYKNYKDAEGWYAITKEFNNPKYALSTFWYAETLRANQKFSEAITQFNAFLNKYPAKDEYTEQAELEIASCSFALYEMRYPRLFQLNRLSSPINQEGSNYTPYFNQGNFYFSSSRPVSVKGKNIVLEDKKDKSKVAKKESPYLNAIYKTSGNPLHDKVSVKKLSSAVKDKEYAAPAFYPDGKIIYVTGWTAKGSRKIYRVNVTSGTEKDWSSPVELGNEVNVEGFNSMQPFVTKDGKYLLFSSNRPGGLGKNDLWYCALRSDGSLGQAVNMGSQINSKEDDEAPYYNYKTKKLLYSSNGRVGIGGLDFYETEGDFSNWSAPRNLGFPFNSSKDDVYFTPLNDSDDEGYISSDRESLCCLEVFHVKMNFLTVQGILLDCNTLKPIEGAVVTLTDSLEQFKMTVDSSGKYSFKVSTNRQIKLKAEKKDYFSKVLTYDYDVLSKADTLFNPDLCLVHFKIDKPIVLKEIYFDFDKADIREDSKIALNQLYTIMSDNEKIEIELSAHTDNIGTAAYNLDLSNRRAKSCVDYLVSKGISASRMISKGYGSSKPIAPNQLPDGKDNPEGRQLNRRTEFKVTKQ